MATKDSPQLLVFLAPEPQNSFNYVQFWERVVAAVPDAVKLSKNVFLVVNPEKRNRAQDEFFGLLMNMPEVEYFSVKICAPLAGSFSVEKEACFDQMGLEPNNMRLLERQLNR